MKLSINIKESNPIAKPRVCDVNNLLINYDMNVWGNQRLNK